MARIYEYRCNLCGHEYELRQEITAKPDPKCPDCQENGAERLISLPLHVSTNDPKTLGTLAERNTRKMGRYELEKKRLERQNNSKRVGNKILEEMGYDPIDTDKIKEPWFTTSQVSDQELNNMTPDQQTKYIQEGKVPPKTTGLF